ncbi:MAG: glycosyltransferase family 39 protein [Bacteroidales bacterium]|nr:glycosyltransferase family 39 protein [Bacteroidales bacterium]MCF8351262.1 glycosyltransferase family 39 protein [Bacteroidales bacterium]MCF8376092.1 glycosyltransferase family 39 protein [Bacteroidales bacterium]MCF8400375.1 glycosyltransferase family 39 protein [Bacteroidales bacterium]
MIRLENIYKRDQLKSLLTDIRFWIVFFFLLRLIGIENAPLEIGHNWRQSLTAMIARNFYEHGFNLFHPMVDLAGEKTGVIGSEFPFFNFLIYLFAEVFGYAHWYGRLINLIVSSFGLYFFYKLIKELLNKKVAFSATIILTVSIWFTFSRKIMPDTFSIALMIIGLYFGYRYLKEGKLPSLLLFFALSTLGMLCKIPALSLFSVLALILFIPTVPLIRKIALYAVAIIGLLMVGLWYFYWVPHLLETYQTQLYFPRTITEGMQEVAGLIPQTLEKFYFSSFKSFLAFLCFLAGIVMLIKNKNKWLISGTGIIFLVFVIFIFKTGEVFAHHNYYIIPFTPVMAVLAGYFLAIIPSKFRYIILFIIVVEAIANQQHDFFIKESNKYRLELEELAEQYIDEDDLIVINGGQSPQHIYFANRKGWTVENEVATDTTVLDSLAGHGARYFILVKQRLNKDIPKYDQIYEGEHYGIYKLDVD